MGKKIVYVCNGPLCSNSDIVEDVIDLEQPGFQVKDMRCTECHRAMAVSIVETED